ncbi:DUF6817 domain-containing protein [Streptomyces sp. NPDC008222]|uniref:DUF6817 domain-containing protein n=1 Tax=Streptomyces sp. NPDC008222 TaxID=3364820 RepID=UPI0036EA45B4
MPPPFPTDAPSPAAGSDGAPDRPEITSFLAARGTDRMPHPGGTLLQHLVRVARLLSQWGADPDVQVAGLCHASYGTAGFDQALLSPTERPVLAELIGDRAEELVYLYASCDRGVVYPRLSDVRPVVFRDRFTGAEHTPPEPDVRAFLEITAANELDVLTHNAELAKRYGPDLYRMFADTRDLLSAAAWQAYAELAPSAGWSAARP